MAAARAAGLRYVSDEHPGLTRYNRGGRVRQGRRWVQPFGYRDTRGHSVRDPATLARIGKLAIPPAWQNVWISPDPRGHLQATGRDARGRKQYRYHARWREERDSTKYSRLLDFGRALPALRRRVAADLRLPGLPHRKVLATVVSLLERTFIRVGNEEYARSNRSFGLTTLENRHVDIHASDVRFHFRGKSGVYHEVAVHDPRIARILDRCRHLPGQELFQYIDDDGHPARIDSADVNEYIKELAGQDFTAKDFRTWAGTVMAAHELLLIAGTGSRRAGRRGEADKPSRPNNKDVVRAIEGVAERLGNTPSVCRKCYVHPEVIACYLDGTLPATLARSRANGRTRGTASLRPDEVGVMTLLRLRLAENSRGSRLQRQLRRSLRAAAPGAVPPSGGSARAAAARTRRPRAEVHSERTN